MLTTSQHLMLVMAVCCSTGLGFFEDDIVLTPEQQITLEVTANSADSCTPQNAVVRNQHRYLWPNAVIPYVFTGLNNQAMAVIREAMDDFNTLTCIKFVERTTESDYINFFSGGGCFSYIGRIGGPQDISIGRGCEFKNIVIHEIFHALGRWHEQSRPDRDLFVRILRDNIQRGRENNFDIISPFFVTTQGVPYDLGTIMHYRSRAFSTNGQPTILPIDPNIPASSLGQRNRLSARDLQHVMALYCPGNSSTGSWSSWTTWTDCSRTCNGGSRQRTRICVGGVRCEGSNVQSERCNTDSCQVPPSWGSWSAWSFCSVSCGGGRQRRMRFCKGGNTCVGIMNEFRTCNSQFCPQLVTWGSWGSWSSCSRTCQGGFRQRNRRCRNGNTCPGSSVDVELCNSNIICTTETVTTEWSSWSACNSECGGGERFRVKLGSDSNATQTEQCNTEDCNPEPELLGLKYRGCWYLNSRAGIIGSLEGRTDDLSDDPLKRTRPVGKCGAGALMYDYRLFGLTFGSYCMTGSNRLLDYTYFPSKLCQNGTGGFNYGSFIMDVYEITNEQFFSNSFRQISSNVNTTLEVNATTTTDNFPTFEVNATTTNNLPTVTVNATATNNLPTVTVNATTTNVFPTVEGNAAINGFTTEVQNFSFKLNSSIMTIFLVFLLAAADL